MERSGIGVHCSALLAFHFFSGLGGGGGGGPGGLWSGCPGVQPSRMGLEGGDGGFGG